MATYWVQIGIGIETDTPEDAAQLAWDEIDQHYFDITDEDTGEFTQVAIADVVEE